MILPLTTNEWNAVRFVVLNLVCVPLIERALHKAHQLIIGHRILNGKPARLRQSRLGNWCLHQEVDELSKSSKITLIAVMVLYVGLSLYTEYASGTLPGMDTWMAPVSKEKSMQGKPVFYDTILTKSGMYPGCRSKESRIEMHRLSEDIVFRKVLNYAPVTANLTYVNAVSYAYDVSIGRSMTIADNGSHILFTGYFGREKRSLYGTMDNERVCLREKQDRLVCFSTSENITMMTVSGIELHIQDAFESIPVENDTKLLLSNDAFEMVSDAEDMKKSEALVELANSRTRDELLKNKKGGLVFGFRFKYKYKEITDSQNCQEKPEILPRTRRMPENPSIQVYSEVILTELRSLNRTRTCLGVFPKGLRVFWESRNSTIVCYETLKDRFCAMKTSNGSTILTRIILHQYDPSLGWSLTWRNQDLDLADLARGALVSFEITRQLSGPRRKSTEAKGMALQLQRGISLLTQVGAPGVSYSIRTGERATIVTWVLVLWVCVSLSGICFLLLVKLLKPRLLPDVEFLYRYAAMQKYGSRSSISAIRNPPTVSASNTEEAVQLHILYGDLDVENLSLVIM